MPRGFPHSRTTRTIQGKTATTETLLAAEEPASPTQAKMTKITNEMRMAFVDKVATGIPVPEARTWFIETYGFQISKSVAYKWVANPTSLNRPRGRPAITTPERLLEKLESKLVPGQSPPTTEDLVPLFEECAFEEWIARGKSIEEWKQREKGFSRKTYHKYKKCAGITTSRIPRKRPLDDCGDLIHGQPARPPLFHFFDPDEPEDNPQNPPARSPAIRDAEGLVYHALLNYMNVLQTEVRVLFFF